MTTTREELALAIDEAEWGWLRPHLERGAVILVGGSLDLVDAGFRIARDDSTVIGQWISEGKIGKPSGEQIELWNSEMKKRFSMLIVSPYVLIQERLPTVH